MGSFSTALSGLSADSVALNTIGNNLANLNTTAFKKQTTNFEDLFYQQIGRERIERCAAGRRGHEGVEHNDELICRAASIRPATQRDMALSGDGFFVVQQNGVQSLTRAGDFQLDSNGNLTTSEGENVMGYNAVNGVISGSSCSGAADAAHWLDRVGEGDTELLADRKSERGRGGGNDLLHAGSGL